MSFPPELVQHTVLFAAVRSIFEANGCECVQKHRIGEFESDPGTGQPGPAVYRFERVDPQTGESLMATITSYSDSMGVPYSEIVAACEDLNLDPCLFERNSH